MIPGMFGEPFKKDRIKCTLCPHFCILKEGEVGRCGVRKNSGGKLFSLNSDKIIAIHTDPIEKKPLYHFLPGTRSLSIAAAGCNFRCKFCQNHSISIIADESEITGEKIDPDKIVEAAIISKASSISYTYTEPTIFFELMYKTAIAAKEAGLKNVMVSNGFISDHALEKLIPVLDGVNIDLKSFTEQFYSDQCGGRLAPVLDTIRTLNKSECWLELTTLLIPELNTSAPEIEQLTSFIAEINPEIPWHVSRFFPNFETLDIEPTDTELIEFILDLSVKKGLKYVYGGNFDSEKWGDTRCNKCNSTLITRRGYDIKVSDFSDGKCMNCSAEIPGVWN